MCELGSWEVLESHKSLLNLGEVFVEEGLHRFETVCAQWFPCNLVNVLLDQLKEKISRNYSYCSLSR